MHHYNHVRLHSAIGYISPKLKLEGKEAEVFNKDNGSKRNTMVTKNKMDLSISRVTRTKFGYNKN